MASMKEKGHILGIEIRHDRLTRFVVDMLVNGIVDIAAGIVFPAVVIMQDDSVFLFPRRLAENRRQ